MGNAAKKPEIDKTIVLGNAFIKALKTLGMPQSSTRIIIGRDRSSIHRDGINPDSKEGELALLFIRCYRSIFAMVDGDESHMKHWFKTTNTHLNGIPQELVQTIDGLVTVTHYLDAMRGKN